MVAGDRHFLGQCKELTIPTSFVKGRTDAMHLRSTESFSLSERSWQGSTVIMMSAITIIIKTKKNISNNNNTYSNTCNNKTGNKSRCP